MRALVFNKNLQYKPVYPRPRTKKDDAFIRVTHAGICNTDLEITKGYMGFRGVLGHEFIGVVDKCDRKYLEGKRVVGEINIGCGECLYCRNNMKNHCPARSVLGILHKDGAFAEFVTLPVKNIHKIPNSISNEEAVFIEPLAAAFEILEQLQIQSSHRVCVLGDGKLGLLVAQALSTTECELVVVGRHREKLSILDEFGIKTKLSSSFGESGFDIVVECTGAKTGIETALKIVKPRGTIVLKTTIAHKNAINLNNLVINEINIIGSRCGPFAPAIEAIKAKKVDLLPMISEMMKLEDGVRAFQVASKKGVLKVVLEIN